MTDEREQSAIEAELLDIRQKHGGLLQPEVVVEEARDAEAYPALHRRLEWDDAAAAHQWRLQQARMIIRVIVRYEQTTDGKGIPCRVFVSLTPDRKPGGDGYRLLADVLSDEDLRRQLLQDARADMIRFKSKYQSLNELAEVFTAMDAVAEEQPEPEPQATLAATT